MALRKAEKLVPICQPLRRQSSGQPLVLKCSIRMWGVKEKNDGRAHARSHREVDNHGDLRTARDRLPNDKRILTIRGRA